MPLNAGTRFERYEIECLVGRGGMGEVYRAKDMRLHRTVALKVLRTDSEAQGAVTEAGGVARLLREARAAAALNHPNSVAIYELGEYEGTFYIAMEFVNGLPLRKYIGDGTASIETKVAWLVDAARALFAAHKAGLVHRDVKPGNIMVSEEGLVKVLDFGLAKPTKLGTDPSGFTTQLGQVLGTPRYMAPEQLEGHAPDASADQFSFGVTAYEVLSGIYPGGPLAGAVTPLDRAKPGVSAELAQVVARMMNREPKERFATMEDAAHALRRCAPSVRVEIARAEREAPATARDFELHASGALAKNATLPLAQPVKLAMGHPMASTPPMPMPTPREVMNRTAPMARPLAVPPAAQSSGRLPESPNSGVYPSPPRDEARRMPSDPSLSLRPDSVTGPMARSAPVATEKKPAAWLLVLVFVIVAVASGGVAAWLLR